jgi:alkylation response protein AidB-like acyl-CoA dehydrogenase
MIADSAADLSVRAAVYAAAGHAEAGLAVESEVAMAKILATEAVARIVDRAMQLTGGAAVVRGGARPLYRLIRPGESPRDQRGAATRGGPEPAGVAAPRSATAWAGTPEAGPA